MDERDTNRTPRRNTGLIIKRYRPERYKRDTNPAIIGRVFHRDMKVREIPARSQRYEGRDIRDTERYGRDMKVAEIWPSPQKYQL